MEAKIYAELRKFWPLQICGKSANVGWNEIKPIKSTCLHSLLHILRKWPVWPWGPRRPRLGKASRTKSTILTLFKKLLTPPPPLIFEYLCWRLRFCLTRSYAALRAVDCIVGPGYSSGGYILGCSQCLASCLRHSAWIGPDLLCNPSSVTHRGPNWRGKGHGAEISKNITDTFSSLTVGPNWWGSGAGQE